MKGQMWFLYVQNEGAEFKKGTIELKDIPKSSKKFLIEKFYVKVTGLQAPCESNTCMSVKSIKPALLDPLKSRDK